MQSLKRYGVYFFIVAFICVSYIFQQEAGDSSLEVEDYILYLSILIGSVLLGGGIGFLINYFDFTRDIKDFVMLFFISIFIVPLGGVFTWINCMSNDWCALVFLMFLCIAGLFLLLSFILLLLFYIAKEENSGFSVFRGVFLRLVLSYILIWVFIYSWIILYEFGAFLLVGNFVHDFYGMSTGIYKKLFIFSHAAFIGYFIYDIFRAIRKLKHIKLGSSPSSPVL